MNRTMNPAPNVLSRVLQANALFSGMSGALLLLFPGGWARLLGILPAPFYALLGLALLAFASMVWWTARRLDTRRAFVPWIVTADTLWVLTTPVAMWLAGNTMTLAGHWLLAGVAVLVALLAILQWRGLGALAAASAFQFED